MRKASVILLNLILVAAAILTSLYSMDHYADGGCDGGLCSLGLIFHALPLAVVWLLQIIAFNLSIGKKRAVFFLLAPALLINTLVYSQNKSLALSELDLENEVLYLVAALCVVFYYRSPGFAKSSKIQVSEPAKEGSAGAHPLILPASVLWLLCNLFSYLQYLFSYGGGSFQSAGILSLLLGLGIWALQLTLIVFVYQRRIWAHYLLFALLLYQSVMLLVFNFKYEVRFFDYVLLVCNLLLLIAVVVQFFRIKTLAGKNNTLL